MIDLGFIGAGIMGERLLRAAAGHAADTVRITGIWDPSAAAMDRIGAALPNVPRADSAEAVIAGAACVYIASPPATHLAHAARVLAAGRALFCEKPLAVDVAAARAFVAGAEGARAAVNFPFASSFAVERLSSWIAEGAVGTPRTLDIRLAFATWPRGWQHDAAGWLDGRAEGGFTREVASHFLFLAGRILGRLTLEEATARFPAGGSERGIAARLSAGKVTITLAGEVGATTADDHNTWTLAGSAGSVRLRDWSIAERARADGAWEADPAALPNEKMRPLVLRRQLESVARLCAGEPQPLATLAEALAVQEIVEAILAAR